MTLHADRCCLFFPRKLRFASRSQSENRGIIVLIILPRKLLRDHDQRWGEATPLQPRDENSNADIFFFSPLSHFLKRLLELFRYIRDYRRRHSWKSRFTRRSRRKEQRRRNTERGKGGTKRHDCVTHRLWPFVNFRGNESFTGANRRGLKLLAMELCRGGEVWIVTRVVHRPV